MTAAAGKDQVDLRELGELSGRLQSLAEELRSLARDQADFLEKLKILGDEVNEVAFCLRRPPGTAMRHAIGDKL